MARFLLVLVVLGAIAWALTRMSRSWHRRIEAGAGLPPLPAAPLSLSDDAFRVEHATYLGTVNVEDWLDRVAAQGLGHRGPASIAVDSSGLVVDRVGTTALFVPQNSITKVELARGLAGRVYGKDGVVVVTWAWGEQLLETGLRVADKQSRSVLISALAQLPSGQLWSDHHRSQTPSGEG